MRLLDALFDSVLDIWTGVTQDDDTTIILRNRARVTGPVKMLPSLTQSSKFTLQ